MLAFLMLSSRWVVVLAGVLLLTGCTPQSVADGTTDLPPGLADYPLGGEPAAWQEPDRLILVLSGSSSCPAVITDIEEKDSTAIATIEITGGPACTADMMQNVYYFTLEGGRPDSVILRSGDDDVELDVVDAD
jgi:hypothetical protein